MTYSTGTTHYDNRDEEDMEQSQWMTAEEIAALLRLHTKTVYTLAKKGTLPGYRFGRSWRFNRAEIVKFVQRKQEDQ